MGYAHVQMMLYRPFLHYVSNSLQTGAVDKRSYACAAACVSVSRNIIHITAEMNKRGSLVGSYWFVMYTTFFAILSLVFFVLENPESQTSQGILKDAQEGKDILAHLARKSLAADRCTAILAVRKQEPRPLASDTDRALRPSSDSFPTAANVVALACLARPHRKGVMHLRRVQEHRPLG
jgi:hypothetical protein